MAEHNENARLEAFSDGVFAIALTLLVIEFKVPNTENIHGPAEMWHALAHMIPMFLAFLLSFAIILISWSNHRNMGKNVLRSSHPYVFANGFLLLGIVLLPFPTALLGETILTDHASPAVVLYVAASAIQSLGWLLMTYIAIKDKLTVTDRAAELMKLGVKTGIGGFSIYLVCAILAFWFPLTIAAVISVLWLLWLILGITVQEE